MRDLDMCFMVFIEKVFLDRSYPLRLFFHYAGKISR